MHTHIHTHTHWHHAGVWGTSALPGPPTAQPWGQPGVPAARP
jgi:hypothetical protein